MVTPARDITGEQRARERAIAFALTLDAVTLTLYTIALVSSGSLTMLAEVTRGALMDLIEFFALIVMKRIHRGRTAAFEFGSGKLEQLVNLTIAGSMLGGALWIGIGAVRELATGEGTGTPAGFALAAIAAAVNLYQNVLAWDSMRRVARGSDSLIMSGQLQSRVVKVVSSGCVMVGLTVAALATDPVVSIWADSLGALLVCGFIAHAAAGMIRTGVPDLVDRAVNEEYQAAINRMLVKHFEDYDRLGAVRTRRSGNVVHAEITLGFDPALTMADVSRRIDGMKATLRQDAGEADVAIVALAG